MATILNRQVTFATNGTVTAAGLHNLIDQTEIYAGIITTQDQIASVGSSDQLLIADADETSTSAPRRVTVGSMFNDALNNGAYTTGSFTNKVTAGSFVGNLTGNVTGTIVGTSGTLAGFNSTTGTIVGLNSTTGTIVTGTVSTLNSTTGTIVTLNSTTSTITNLSATTSTFLGTITGSTNVINIGSGQIYKDASGLVGIGTVSPSEKLSVYDATSARINVSGDLATTITAYRASTDAAQPIVNFKKARGTQASPSAVATGDPIGTVQFQAFGGTNTRTLSVVSSFIEAYTSDTNISSYLQFSTSSSGSATATEKMRIDASGNVGISTTSPRTKLEVSGIVASSGTTGGFQLYDRGVNSSSIIIYSPQAADFRIFDVASSSDRFKIDTSGNCLVVSAANLGYGSGSGGTVTQGTSKITGVTLNKPTGQITMHNASLANGASVNFALTNSFISAVDVLVVNPTAYSGYTAQCQNTSTGAANIRVTNISGGALAEPVTLQFAVIKGSAT